MSYRCTYSTVLSFLCGLVVGYASKLYFTRKDADRMDLLQIEVNQIYHSVQKLQSQINDVKQSLTRTTSTQGNGSEREKNCLSQGNGEVINYNSVNTEEVFYDTIDSLEPCEEIESKKDWVQCLFQQVDRQMEDPTSDKEVVCAQLKTHLDTLSENANYCWRLSKALFFLSKSEPYSSAAKRQTRKALLQEASAHAGKALQLDESNADCHKWYAITIGALSDYVGPREKVQNGILFKQHLDIAMKLRPQDSTLFHLAGRFCAELMSISWLERKLASSLLGPLPSVSHQDTIKYFMQAHQLRPAWKENVLFLVKALVAAKERHQAKQFLDQGLALPVNCPEDAAIQQQLMHFTKELSDIKE